MSTAESTKAKPVEEITSREHFYSLINAGKPVILDASATWCGPCKAIAPQYEKWAETFTNIKFAKFDVDEVSDVAKELGVRAMPTFFVFQDGEKVETVMGANPPAILKVLEKYKDAAPAS